jgi:hypothetical protein
LAVLDAGILSATIGMVKEATLVGERQSRLVTPLKPGLLA